MHAEIQCPRCQMRRIATGPRSWQAAVRSLQVWLEYHLPNCPRPLEVEEPRR